MRHEQRSYDTIRNILLQQIIHKVASQCLLAFVCRIGKAYLNPMSHRLSPISLYLSKTNKIIRSSLMMRRHLTPIQYTAEGARLKKGFIYKSPRRNCCSGAVVNKQRNACRTDPSFSVRDHPFINTNPVWYDEEINGNKVRRMV